MTSRQNSTPSSRPSSRPSSTQNPDKCIHTSSEMCQCKAEMEKKFQDFKVLSGAVFKEQLEEQVNERTDNLFRENAQLKNENKQIVVLRRLYDNVYKQVSLHETLIGKQKDDISNLTERNKVLQSTVDNVIKQNEELKLTVKEANDRNNKLEKTVDELRELIKDTQERIKTVEDKQENN